MTTENYEPQVVRTRARGLAENLLVFKEGRTLLHAVVLDGHVRTVELPKVEQRYFAPLEFRGKPYPIGRAARGFLRAGKTLGITDGAKKVLQTIREATRRSV